MAARESTDRAAPLGDPRAGYVLIEAIAVLALTGLLLSVGFATLTPRTSRAGFAATVAASVSLLRDARSAALSEGRVVTASFDANTRLLSAGAQRVALPPDLALSLDTGGNCPAAARSAGILFRPDGTNCGGVLRFALDRRISRVTVNWVTGRIEVIDGD